MDKGQERMLWGLLLFASIGFLWVLVTEIMVPYWVLHGPRPGRRYSKLTRS